MDGNRGLPLGAQLYHRWEVSVWNDPPSPPHSTSSEWPIPETPISTDTHSWVEPAGEAEGLLQSFSLSILAQALDAWGWSREGDHLLDVFSTPSTLPLRSRPVH